MSFVGELTDLVHDVLVVSDPHQDDLGARVNDGVVHLGSETLLQIGLHAKLYQRNRPVVASRYSVSDDMVPSRVVKLLVSWLNIVSLVPSEGESWPFEIALFFIHRFIFVFDSFSERQEREHFLCDLVLVIEVVDE